MTSVWKRIGDFEVPLRQFSSDFRVLVSDVEGAYKLGHRDAVTVEVRPYGDFVAWAREQEPDWDRYAWDGTKVLVEQGRLPKSALDNYDNPKLERAGVTADEWYRLGFEHYVNSIAKSIAEGKNVPPLLAIPEGPIDGRHRALAAQKLGLHVAPVIELHPIAGFGAAARVKQRRVTKQRIDKRLDQCMGQIVRACDRVTASIFQGCPEVAHLAARTIELLGYEAVIVVGRAPAKDGKIIGHVWVEIPELDLGVETNPSQMRGWPLMSHVHAISEFTARGYQPMGTYPEDLDAVRNALVPADFERLRLNPNKERFYDELAAQAAACVQRAK